jgi:hypothetical protein
MTSQRLKKSGTLQDYGSLSIGKPLSAKMAHQTGSVELASDAASRALDLIRVPISALSNNGHRSTPPPCLKSVANASAEISSRSDSDLRGMTAW